MSPFRLRLSRGELADFIFPATGSGFLNVKRTTPDIRTMIDMKMRKSVHDLYASTSSLNIRESSHLRSNLSSNQIKGKEKDLPKCGVYTIKYRDDKGRVIYSQTTVKTDDLKDGCNHKQDNSKNSSCASKLISRVFMR